MSMLAYVGQTSCHHGSSKLTAQPPACGAKDLKDATPSFVENAGSLWSLLSARRTLVYESTHATALKNTPCAHVLGIMGKGDKSLVLA